MRDLLSSVNRVCHNPQRNSLVARDTTSPLIDEGVCRNYPTPDYVHFVVRAVNEIITGENNVHLAEQCSVQTTV